MNDKSIFDNRFVSAGVLILLLAIVVGMWLWLPTYLTSGLGLSKQGLYGDSFGSVNSLFTGLAFAALIFTILLQQREINLQRFDLRNQTDEMKKSRQQIKRQADLQEKQIKLDIASLKMKKLEVEIVEIQMLAMQWVESARYNNVKLMFESLKTGMQEILEEVDEPS